MRSQALSFLQVKQEQVNSVIWKSSAMRDVMQKIECAAKVDSNVLLLGETGVGKGLLALKIHQLSNRHGGPFVALDCTCIPANLAESLLFGHVKGAFTGADRDQPGRFELANQGTIFIDEIGELPLLIQAKFLRVLEERIAERIGDVVSRQIDVRIVAATNVDLEQEAMERRFRQDLWYRINVIPIWIPPLRERVEDIKPLVEHFVHQKGAFDVSFSPAAWGALEAYSWDGNIRELQNVLERSLVFRKSNLIGSEDLQFNPQTRAALSTKTKEEPPTSAKVSPEEVLKLLECDPQQTSLARAQENFERFYVQQVIKAVDNNKKSAAEILCITRNTMRRKLRPPS